MELQLADWQEEIALHPARFQFVAGGRRVGKSWVAAYRIILRSLRKAGHKTMYASPVSSQHEEVVDNILGVEGVEEYIENTRTRPTRIRFKNGSRAEFRAFERAKNIRGKGIHDLIVDESQDISQRSYETVARPLVSAGSGSILLLGQLRGRDWRYRNYFEPGQVKPGTPTNPIDFGQPRFKSWLVPSPLGPAFQSEKGRLEIQLAKAELSPWIFAQEYMCELCANPNAAFRADLLERIKNGRPNQPDKAGRYVLGFDIGKVTDCSAAVVLNSKTGQIEHSEKFPLGMEHAQQARKLGALARQWNDALVILDATGGAAPGGSVKNEYIKLYSSQCPAHHLLYQVWQNKAAMMECLALEIEQQKINIPPEFESLHEELQQYECEYRNGIWRFHGPDGHGDDLVSGLSMAVYARVQGWSSVIGTYRGGL